MPAIRSTRTHRAKKHLITHKRDTPAKRDSKLPVAGRKRSTAAAKGVKKAIVKKDIEEQDGFPKEIIGHAGGTESKTFVRCGKPTKLS